MKSIYSSILEPSKFPLKSNCTPHPPLKMPRRSATACSSWVSHAVFLSTPGGRIILLAKGSWLSLPTKSYLAPELSFTDPAGAFYWTECQKHDGYRRRSAATFLHCRANLKQLVGTGTGPERASILKAGRSLTAARGRGRRRALPASRRGCRAARALGGPAA